jgi:hypothetical protein
MKIIITKSQYQKLVFSMLDTFYGPELSFKEKDDLIDILSNDGEDIFTVYTKGGRAKGCKKDMLVPSGTLEEIEMYIPPAVLRKKLFSKTLISYVNEKTNLDIDCIEFWYNWVSAEDNEIPKKYNFNVKKNKRTDR